MARRSETVLPRLPSLKLREAPSPPPPPLPPLGQSVKHTPESALVVARTKFLSVRFVNRLFQNRPFQAFHFAGDLPRVSWPNIRLEHERYPRSKLSDGVCCPTNHVEDGIPVTLDRGEHGIRVMRQTRLPHNSHRRSNSVVDGAIRSTGAAGRNRKRDEHNNLP